jgi:hypothetical protein
MQRTPVVSQILFGLSRLVSSSVGLYGIETTDQERFYFSPPDMKQPNGKQFNRTTNSGYWKVTGKDKEVWSGGRLIGKKKILVFHLGSAAKSKKTDWVMHEYHTTLEELDGTKLPGQVGFLSRISLICVIDWRV